MSKTVRRCIRLDTQVHTLKLEADKKIVLDQPDKWVSVADGSIILEISTLAQQYANTHIYSYKLPKFYRNLVNRKRRAKDRAALHKELTVGYGEFCNWDCNSSEAWGYF